MRAPTTRTVHAHAPTGRAARGLPDASRDGGRRHDRPALRRALRFEIGAARGRADDRRNRRSDRASPARARGGARRRDRRPGRPHLHARLDRPARAPVGGIEPRSVFRAVSTRRHRVRVSLGRIRREDAARGFHDGARSRRPCLDRDPRCDSPGPGQGTACIRRRQVHRDDGRPRRPEQRHEFRDCGGTGAARPDRGRDQRGGRGAPRGSPAIQGRLRPDQDHRDGRRALLREER